MKTPPTVSELAALNPKIAADVLGIYRDALASYVEAAENIAKNGAVTGHPKTGAPIENPYLAVREQSQRVITKFHRENPEFNPGEENAVAVRSPKKQGREPATSPKGLIGWPNYFPTQATCAIRTGVPIEVLRAAKSAGCPAFRACRVYFAEFLVWYFQNSGEVGKGLNFERERLTREQADELARENALAEGRLHTLESVESIVWEQGLALVREAWTNYPKTCGLKLRSILAADGVKPETIERAVAEAVLGVTEPLARLREMEKKPVDSEPDK